MGIGIQGNGGVIAEVGGTTHRALRVENRPLDHGSLGVFRFSMLSGTMAAGLAANAEIYQFRWTHASNLCAVQRVILDGLSGSATAFAAGFGKVDLLAARSFSASGTGGTAATITGNNGKLRSSMASTTLGEIRCASTAALGVGTKTLDTQSMGQISLSFGTVVSVQYLSQVVLIGEDIGMNYPLLLAQNEGFAIRASVPATGTWQFGVTVHFTEVTAY